MKTYTKEQLDKILKDHKLWIESGGKEGERADLSNANLSHFNLENYYFYYSTLTYADLSTSDLSNANLSNANLYKACLYWANLSNAKLINANLSFVNMEDANFRNADLSNANLYRAYTYLIKLEGATLPDFSIVPKEGSFIAYKKLNSGAIAKLRVPEDAERISCLRSRTCRVSRAKVLEISNGLQKDVDILTKKLVYKVGKYVKPDSFNNDIRHDNRNGINCFMTEKEAKEYQI
jgi:hypothetical protein